ncbi:A24 family peptidase [Candidatus Woesearchaeota archaeon]|nr:A24 family peptidase [Candidatus Woesearchaeota archaeon]
MIDLLLLLIGLAALIIASYTDLKTREVPDYLSAAIIIGAFGLRLMHSIFYNDWWFLFNGAIAFGIFVAIAFALFYSGQWGGGDAKLLMAIGAVFATYPSILLGHLSPILNIYFPLILLLNILVIGAIYSLIWGITIALINHRNFWLHFKKIRHEKKIRTLRIMIFIICAALLIATIFIPDFILKLLFITCALVAFLSIHLWLFAKTIEACCMIKETPISKLTEGDWIVENVYRGKKKICGPKDLGISLEQIKLLKKYKIKSVLVKRGIPFVPGILAAVIFTLVFGNLFLGFI